jgi:hypothetical protein
MSQGSAMRAARADRPGQPRPGNEERRVVVRWLTVTGTVATAAGGTLGLIRHEPALGGGLVAALLAAVLAMWSP